MKYYLCKQHIGHQAALQEGDAHGITLHQSRKIGRIEPASNPNTKVGDEEENEGGNDGK